MMTGTTLTSTRLTVASGRDIDLLDVRAADFEDFAWVAEHLAKLARFNGATPEVFYSVAQHCVVGATIILQHGYDEELAAYFLLHDVHEALLGDRPTPLKNAARALAGRAPEELELEARIDPPAHQAAGLAWPPQPSSRELIKHYDLVMLVTELRDLMPRKDLAIAPISGVYPLKQKLIPWQWPHARTQWLREANHLLPALNGAAP
jgi:hypothetical protein